MLIKQVVHEKEFKRYKNGKGKNKHTPPLQLSLFRGHHPRFSVHPLTLSINLYTHISVNTNDHKVFAPYLKKREFYRVFFFFPAYGNTDLKCGLA